MGMFKKRRHGEQVWGQDGKVREDHEIPKPEVILGPAGDSSINSSVVNENAMGFLGTMAAAASSNESGLDSSSSSENTRPASSPYGWEPSSSSSSGLSSSPGLSSSISSSDSDVTDKVFRLQRKIDGLVERIEELERKARDN
jgi:hypothetical protein